MMEQQFILQWLALIPMSVMIASVIIFGFKYERNDIVIVISIIGLVLTGVLLYYASIDTQKYSDSVNEEIENASCDDLIKMYDDYVLFKEKIKAKYIFNCVADKEYLELLN